MNILITAGPTCEDIDPVRCLTNRSSGKMGFALALASLKLGHETKLISGPCALNASKGVEWHKVRSAADMYSAVKKHFEWCDCLIMSAAVADYTPVVYSKCKLKKTASELAISLKPTRDILKSIARNKGNRILIGFALETGGILECENKARKKMAEKNLDAIVLNTPESIDADNTSVDIITTDSGVIALKNRTKYFIAKKIVRSAEELWKNR